MERMKNSYLFFSEDTVNLLKQKKFFVLKNGTVQPSNHNRITCVWEGTIAWLLIFIAYQCFLQHRSKSIWYLQLVFFLLFSVCFCEQLVHQVACLKPWDTSSRCSFPKVLRSQSQACWMIQSRGPKWQITLKIFNGFWPRWSFDLSKN